jgi:hypothetical protein
MSDTDKQPVHFSSLDIDPSNFAFDTSNPTTFMVALLSFMFTLLKKEEKRKREESWRCMTASALLVYNGLVSYWSTNAQPTID